MGTLSKKIKKIGFVIKHHQSQANELTAELAKACIEDNVHVYFASESKTFAARFKKELKPSFRKLVKTVHKPALVDHCDLIVVLGGDGTLLSIARLMKNRSTPVMGINMGQLGFLTEIKATEAKAVLRTILAQKPVEYSERVLLEVTVKRKNKTVFQGPVVNDAVISKGAIARIIGLDIHLNKKFVSKIRADGLILSTPTGSTAYSLSAGGPIIEPTLKSLIIAPICPHSLTQRPLIIPDDMNIEVCLSDRPGHVLLTLDGQDVVTLQEDDVVSVRRFKKHALKLISSPTRDYFSLLREKLNFGMR